ncbi:MAG: hypothetical protein ACI9YH_004597 [Colwellia sp.]|jgi:hypothetical protein
MSPEQLKALHSLSQLFEEGIAGPSQIKELSFLLGEINKNQCASELFPNNGIPHARANTDTL